MWLLGPSEPVWPGCWTTARLCNTLKSYQMVTPLKVLWWERQLQTWQEIGPASWTIREKWVELQPLWAWEVRHWTRQKADWFKFLSGWCPWILLLHSLTGIVQPSKDNTKVYAAVGSEVTLPCVFSPGSFPSGSAWEKLNPGSTFLKNAPSHLPASFSTSLPSSQPTLDRSATLKEVQFEDRGMYRCSGAIEGQRLTRKMQLVVAKSKIPGIEFKQ